MDKNFNEFFDELNDMANFKNFGEKEEEIIIDGVNVAGCEHNYVVSNKLYCGADYECVHSDCENYPNCYYKQLKRLQQDYVNLSKAFEHLKTSYQENQEYVLQLKDENASLKNERTADLVKQIDELKAENERLKEEIKEVKKYQYEQEFLEKEIEEQREKNKRLTCKILEVKALNETLNVQCTSQDCTQLRKLHQTLQEIKDIVYEVCKVCQDNVTSHCEQCFYNKILSKCNKISEVE